jgi:hypothetical protein
VLAAGGRVRVLGTAYTNRFARGRLPAGAVAELGRDRAGNRALWDTVVDELQPDVVVFADYPLLFFRSGSAPLADRAWCERVTHGEAVLVTLDCLGYAQRAQTIFFGPPHLSAQVEHVPALPSGMHVLLPCPLHDPAPRAGRRGVPFRSGSTASVDAGPGATRGTYARDGELLIVHISSSWAWDWAKTLGLPHYEVLARILEHYLADLPRPVAVVSVNDGHLLRPMTRPGFRVQNLASLSPDAFERLILASDLVLAENRVSVSLGQAACAARPCAVLRNGDTILDVLARLHGPLRDIALEMEHARLGAVFPYDVFPIWGPRELAQLGIMDDNELGAGIAVLELFGGATTRQRLRALLLDPGTRAGLATAQTSYAERVRRLPLAHEVLRDLVDRRGRPDAGTPGMVAESCT